LSIGDFREMVFDGFFTAVFAEDAHTLRNLPEVHA
jgi:hypothetical protein